MKRILWVLLLAIGLQQCARAAEGSVTMTVHNTLPYDVAVESFEDPYFAGQYLIQASDTIYSGSSLDYTVPYAGSVSGRGWLAGYSEGGVFSDNFYGSYPDRTDLPGNFDVYIEVVEGRPYFSTSAPFDAPVVHSNLLQAIMTNGNPLFGLHVSQYAGGLVLSSTNGVDSFVGGVIGTIVTNKGGLTNVVGTNAGALLNVFEGLGTNGYAGAHDHNLFKVHSRLGINNLADMNFDPRGTDYYQEVSRVSYVFFTWAIVFSAGWMIHGMIRRTLEIAFGVPGSMPFKNGLTSGITALLSLTIMVTIVAAIPVVEGGVALTLAGYVPSEPIWTTATSGTHYGAWFSEAFQILDDWFPTRFFLATGVYMFGLAIVGMPVLAVGTYFVMRTLT